MSDMIDREAVLAEIAKEGLHILDAAIRAIPAAKAEGRRIRDANAKLAEGDGLVDAVYLRDIDGTGSLHVCSKGDSGAIAHVPATSIATLTAQVRNSQAFLEEARDELDAAEALRAKEGD